MAKVVRNTLIALIGIFAMLFAGVFFAGCGVDYGKVYLTNDHPEGINLTVDDEELGSTSVLFDINGYQNGLSNAISVAQRGGEGKIFDYTYSYISQTRIRVNVTAVSGGSAELVVKLLDGSKESSVRVDVRQFSKTMSYGGDVLYVSGGDENKGGTAFVPTSSIFNFDSNTTEKDVSYFLIQKDVESANVDNLQNVKDLDLESGTATLTNNVNRDVHVNLIAFDRAELVGETLEFTLGGQQQKSLSPTDVDYKLFVSQSKFRILAIYQPSLQSEKNIISQVVPVNILPSLNVNFFGAYFDMNSNQTLEETTFTPLNDKDADVLIVPNNPKMTDFIIKVQMTGIDADTPVGIQKFQDTNFVDFDRFYENPADTEDKVDEEGNVISYWKISQSTQKQNEVTVGLNIFYEVAKQIFGDESVNRNQNFNVKIVIAPQSIRVNGLENEDVALEVYNVYDDQIYPNGYVNFSIDVVSSYGSLPKVDGLWFEVDDGLDAVIGSTSLGVYGENNLLTNWNGDFRVRTANSVAKGPLFIKVHAVSKGIIYNAETGECVDEIIREIKVNIIDGASEVRLESQFINPEKGNELFVDYERRMTPFDNVLYANANFKDVRVEFRGGTNILSFRTIYTNGFASKHEEGEVKYYLNLEITPLRLGDGVYDFFLDNGTSYRGLTFHCTRLLKEETTAFQFTSTGNSAVTKAEFSSSAEDLNYQDCINLEILNPSSKDEVVYGSTVSFTFKGNYDSVVYPSSNEIVSVTANRANWTFTLTTRINGACDLEFDLSGPAIANGFAEARKSLLFKIHVSSYSLVSEFYLKNGDAYALSNTVYYGGSISSYSVELTPNVFNENSTNFYRYTLDGESISRIYDNCSGGEDGIYTYEEGVNIAEQDSVIKLEYNETGYDKNYVYFNIANSMGPIAVSFRMRIVKNDEDSLAKTVVFTISRGLMFYLPERATYGFDGDEYEVDFKRGTEWSNEFKTGSFGSLIYNPDNFEFKYSLSYLETIGENPFVLSAFLKQPNLTKRYDATIVPQEYVEVKTISRVSGSADIDFSNENLVQTVGVLTNPTYATDNSIRIEFIPNATNEYSASMLTYTVDDSQRRNGIYTIALSVEEFFERYKDQITNINADLSGKLYIYPAEWGTSYTSLDSSQNPVCFNIQYRNGSRLNPYLLRSAQDVLDIGKNDIKLSSHYELRERISMAAVNNATPIGIVDGKVVGFSGTIVGTTSQASITDIIISDTNFKAVVGGKVYAGLFAKINQNPSQTDVVGSTEVTYELPSIENVSFSGRFNSLSLSGTAYVGLLAAINQGSLVNIATRIEKGSRASSINAGNSTVYFGTVAGLNFGQLTQNFEKYDEKTYFRLYDSEKDGRLQDDGLGGQYFTETVNNTSYTYFVSKDQFVVDEHSNTKYYVVNQKNEKVPFKKVSVNKEGSVVEYFLPLREAENFAGQTTKIMAYYDDYVNINTNGGNVYAGGVVGATNSGIKRIEDGELVLLGYSKYTSYTLLKVTGQTNGNVDVGGVAGVLTYVATGSLLPNEIAENNEAAVQTSFALDNLLVGGIIDSIDVTGTRTASGVGGVVGYADSLTSINRDIFVSNNTIRTFLRGFDDVGAVVGYENYHSSEGSSNVYYSSEKGQSVGGNTIEAVDIGGGIFESSMIIRQAKDGLTNDGAGLLDTIQDKIDALDEKLKDSPDDESLKNQRQGLLNEQIVVAGIVGNAYRNDRKYDAFTFETASYLARTLQEKNGGAELDQKSPDTDKFYGDILIVNKTVDKISYVSSFVFEHKEVELNIGKETPFKLSSSDGASGVDVFFMYYFSVQGVVGVEEAGYAQDEISRLNYITTNSDFHPLKPAGGTLDLDPDITISGSSSVLNVDVSANITVKNTGLAKLNVSSILNVIKTKTIYILAVNYFKKDINSSLFFADNNINGSVVDDNTSYVLRGDKKSKLYLRPSYLCETTRDVDGKEFSISQDGILNYQGKNYILNPNTDLTVDVDPKEGSFSRTQVDGQTVIFYKTKKPEVENAVDNYSLTPVLRVEVEGQVYVFELDGAKLSNLPLTYKESPERVFTGSTLHRITTNQNFEDYVEIVSTNDVEFVYYEIHKVVNGQTDPNSVQSRRVEQNSIDAWKNYVNNETNNDLFDFTFKETSGKQYSYVCAINQTSDKYKNRYLNPIYGEYILEFHSSKIDDNGTTVMCSTRVYVDEAELKFIGINNYSNINDVSTTAEVVVPSQRGLLEVTLDPIEAVFDTFTISNNAANYQQGATEISLSFAYETSDENGSVVYETVPNFGLYRDGSLTFTYEQMINFLNKQGDARYRGKVYISYIMPASSVSDKVPVGFDIAVVHGGENKETIRETRMYYTRLGSYARLRFASKNAIDNTYYVARGLEYSLILDSFGFEREQITMTSSNTKVANVVEENGAIRLQISPDVIIYQQGYPGLYVTITTSAFKIVDNVRITFDDSLKLCVMDFVMNYDYTEGVNEDVVRGMENGVITNTIGNPYTLELAITDFLEYDKNNQAVVENVNNFVSRMTSQVVWTVYESGLPDVNLGNQTQTYRSNFFLADGLTITPLRVYNHTANIYHFSVSGYYLMDGGTYIYSSTSIGTDRFYTEFSFDVNEQSTEESPLPIEKVDEFMNMGSNQWYILLNDITLRNTEQATAEQTSQFMPLTSQIAGFDGNGYEILMGGEYNMTDLTDIGIFATVRENCIIKNMTISLTKDVTINVNTPTYNIGLLTAANEGTIANAVIKSNGHTLSVVYRGTEAVSASYVSGIAAANSGFITNSRSDLNISANVNLSGIVGNNSGKIAGCYYKGGSLYNYTLGTTELTAGFVIENSGEIYSSYVSGQANADDVYYKGTQNTLHANNNIAGFVYENSGVINDCYTNINMEGNGSYVAGFTITNSGTIDRCISWSVLNNRNDSGYGFAGFNELDTEDVEGGKITNCYFLQDPDPDGNGDTSDGVNVNIGNLEDDPNAIILPLTLKQFELGEQVTTEGDAQVDPNDDFTSLFDAYSYQTTKGANAVWFYNDGNAGSRDFGTTVFNKNRLELVSPNIIAFSRRNLDSVESVVDPETGAENVVYNYVYDTTVCEALGAIHNPILIGSATDLEEYVVRQNNSVNINRAYYRLISDIRYDENSDNSALSSTKFLGYFEGNHMEIADIKLVSNNKQNYAGLFAEIGSSDISSVGVVMNMTLTPNEVNFPNATVVGGLAGRLYGGKVFNVDVLPESGITVQGANIVGGVIGLAVGNYEMAHINSTASAKARFLPNLAGNNFNQNSSLLDEYSYAGALVGVATGSGTIKFSKLEDEIRVTGGKVGLMFGLIDTGVTVKDMTIYIQEETRVTTYSQTAGLFVGQSRGNVSGVKVFGLAAVSNPFETTSYVPESVGGFAGTIDSGEVTGVYVSQNILASTTSTRPFETDISTGRGIKYIGGFAGKIVGSASISDVTVDSISIVGTEFVGGVVGGTILTGGVSFADIHVSASLKATGLTVAEAGVGGLVGVVGEGATVKLTATKIQDEKIVRNEFNIEASMEIRVYSLNLASYNLGAIIGLNQSKYSHNVDNSNSSITGKSSIKSVGANENWTESIQTALRGEQVVLEHTSSDEHKPIVHENVFSASECSYSAKVEFELNSETMQIYLTNYGSAVAFN